MVYNLHVGKWCDHIDRCDRYEVHLVPKDRNYKTHSFTFSISEVVAYVDAVGSGILDRCLEKAVEHFLNKGFLPSSPSNTEVWYREDDYVETNELASNESTGHIYEEAGAGRTWYSA